MSSVTLKNISKSFGRVEVIRDFSLDIGHGEFVVFIGPSGCGKSTLLRMIAGLESISGGQLEIGGKSLNEVPAADRGIAMVFQSYALYPHMNVSQNIGFGLKMAGMSAADVARKVNEAAVSLQITELLERRPRELSGGQRQRVAIGRAIVKQPDVFLFDEPLSNLDADLRSQMRVEIARLHKLFGTTVIYVTHDQIEAMTLADRIVVLRDGKVEQVGTPDQLYEKPANTFVAQFLGQPKMNLIPGRTRVADAGMGVEIAGNFLIECPPLGGPVSDGDTVILGIRPGDVSIARKGAANAIKGKVDFVEHLGNEVLVHVRVEGIESGLVAILPKRADVIDDDPIWLTWERSEAHLFNEKGIKL